MIRFIFFLKIYRLLFLKLSFINTIKKLEIFKIKINEIIYLNYFKEILNDLVFKIIEFKGKK
jgi:hypothetical protein